MALDVLHGNTELYNALSYDVGIAEELLNTPLAHCGPLIKV